MTRYGPDNIHWLKRNEGSNPGRIIWIYAASERNHARGIILLTATSPIQKARRSQDVQHQWADLTFGEVSAAARSHTRNSLTMHVALPLLGSADLDLSDRYWIKCKTKRFTIWTAMSSAMLAYNAESPRLSSRDWVKERKYFEWRLTWSWNHIWGTIVHEQEKKVGSPPRSALLLVWLMLPPWVGTMDYKRMNDQSSITSRTARFVRRL